MQRLLLILSIFTLAACATRPATQSGEPQTPAPDSNQNLISALGMEREADDLGYAEKSFNPCNIGMSGGCGNRYFSVVHFQLLCRDSEGSVSEVPVQLQPISADHVKWKVGGQSGGTRTDANGYGQFSLMSNRSVRGQRLILRIGPQFVAFTVSEVSKIILPKNFCRS